MCTQRTKVVTMDDPVELMNRKNESFSCNTNWVNVLCHKKLADAIAMVPKSEAPEKFDLDEIVSEESCLILSSQPDVSFEQEPCKIEISLKGKKISRIGIVSEASVIEFFTKWGEYAGTTFAKLIDEYEGASVYLAELNYPQPTSEVSIRFTRVENARSDMYLYGIKLVVEDDCFSSKELDMFTSADELSREEMSTFMKYITNKVHQPRSANLNKNENTQLPMEQPTIQHNMNDTKELQFNIQSYIDKKFLEMEDRLVLRMKEIEAKTNEKLDAIMKLLESQRISN